MGRSVPSFRNSFPPACAIREARWPSAWPEFWARRSRPYIAVWLARNWGLQYVGYYLTLSAVLTFLGLLWIRETKDDDLAAQA